LRLADLWLACLWLALVACNWPISHPQFCNRKRPAASTSRFLPVLDIFRKKERRLWYD
jgi:hypothetical protein